MDRDVSPALLRIVDQVREAAASRRPLRVRGGGSKDFYGEAGSGDLLETAGYHGIVSHEPSELVISVRAGTPLRELEQALARHGQCLAFEPPHFGANATVGGMVAAGLAGPSRRAGGSVREHVLGVTLLAGEGELMRFGGQVMKNVAGYDISRAIAGSLGTLGVLVDVSLKVVARPAAQATWRLHCAQDEALQRLNAWAREPLRIQASAWHDGVLCVRAAGTQAAIDAVRAALKGSEVDEAEARAWWISVREHTHAFFASVASNASLWRLAVPATAAPIALPGSTLLEWGGAQRWLASEADADEVRSAAGAASGHATLFRRGGALSPQVPVFTPLDPVQARIHRALKQAFDPRGVFNPGRLYRAL